MTEHEKWLIDQYNRNRPFEKHINNMAEYNRVMLDLEIKDMSRMSRIEYLKNEINSKRHDGWTEQGLKDELNKLEQKNDERNR